MMSRSHRLLSWAIGSAVVLSLLVLLRPATSEGEPAAIFERPLSADKDGGCSSEHWPYFSQECLRSADVTPVRTVTSTTLIDLGPTDPERIVLPRTTAPSALDAFAYAPEPVDVKPKPRSRTRPAQAQTSGNATAMTSPILYGQ